MLHIAATETSPFGFLPHPTLTKTLDLDARVQRLLPLRDLVVGLGAHNAATPVALRVLDLVGVALLDGGQQLAELGLVLGPDFGEGEDGGGLALHVSVGSWLTGERSYLLVHHGAQARLALDDGIRHAHLAAESGQENDEFDGIDVVRDQDQAGLFVLHQPHHMIQPVLDRVRLLAHVLLFLPIGDGGRFLGQALLLLCARLWAVLVQ